nr:hypothetical protein [Actinomadura rubteroloni]
MQAGERLRELVARNLVFLHVERLEDGLVHEPSLVVVALEVGRLRVFQQRHGQLDKPGRVAQGGVSVVQPGAQLAALRLNLPQFALDLFLGQFPVRRQVEQVVLLRIEGRELRAELLVQEAGTRLLLRDGLVQVRPHRRHERRSKADRVVVRFDQFLQLHRVDVRCHAEPRLPSPAEEVEVRRPMPVRRLLHDEAASFTLGRTRPAEQRPLEVVVVDATELVGGGPCFDDFLHAVEEVLVDDGVVPARVDLALVDDVAEVVAVTQHLGQRRDRQRLRRVGGGRPGGEATVVQFVGEVGQRVVAGGVQLERLADERAALRVNDDRADFPAVDSFGGVEVPDGRAVDRAAVADLVGHLDLDVLAAHADLQLVEDRHDALHGVAEVAVAEVLLGGDEGDAHLGELSLGGEFFQCVTEGAGHHVDDDVAHGGALFEVGHHLLEDRSLVDAGGAAAGLHVLVCYGDAHRVGFGLRDAALCRNGVALWVEVGVGVHLLLRRHAQVEERFFDSDRLVLPAVRDESGWSRTRRSRRVEVGAYRWFVVHGVSPFWLCAVVAAMTSRPNCAASPSHWRLVMPPCRVRSGQSMMRLSSRSSATIWSCGGSLSRIWMCQCLCAQKLRLGSGTSGTYSMRMLGMSAGSRSGRSCSGAASVVNKVAAWARATRRRSSRPVIGSRASARS